MSICPVINPSVVAKDLRKGMFEWLVSRYTGISVAMVAVSLSNIVFSTNQCLFRFSDAISTAIFAIVQILLFVLTTFKLSRIFSLASEALLRLLANTCLSILPDFTKLRYL